MKEKETKTTSVSLSLFATPHELADYIRIMVKKYDLEIFFYVLSEDKLIIGEVNDLESIIPTSERIFLCPIGQAKNNFTMNDISPRESGWIDIRPGKLLEIDGIKMLTLTQIDGETSKKGEEKAPISIKWLKRQIKSDVIFGVYGFVSTGASGSYYKDIGYTQEAVSLFDSGVIWKQNPTFKPFFRPNNIINP